MRLDLTGVMWDEEFSKKSKLCIIQYVVFSM